MSILKRLTEAGRIRRTSEGDELFEDDHGEEIVLFEKYEFPVFMQFAAIYADPQKVYGALHYISEWGIDTPQMYFASGKTPMEIAWEIYTFCLGHGAEHDEIIFQDLEIVYDGWGKFFTSGLRNDPMPRL